MDEKEVLILLDKKQRTIKVGRINMGIRMKAIKESTEAIPMGNSFINQVDYLKSEILEMIFSQCGIDKITYADYLKLHPSDGGDELISTYRSINYGGKTVRERFQEDSVGESNKN